MFKVSNRNTWKMCEICSKLTIKTLERRQWRRSGIFIVKPWTYFTSFFNVSIVDFEQVNISWELKQPLFNLVLLSYLSKLIRFYSDKIIYIYLRKVQANFRSSRPEVLLLYYYIHCMVINIPFIILLSHFLQN